MATKNETPPPAPTEPAAPPKRKLGKLLIIVSLVTVLLIGGGLAAFLLLTKNHAEDDTEVATSEEKPKKKKKEEKGDHKPAYMPLDPFTVNLASETGDQFLQVALTLDMQTPEAAEKAKIYLAKIRNDVMLHLSGKKPQDIASKEGKMLLAVELRNQINTILEPESPGKKGGKAGSAPPPPVKEVLFTSFIIQ